MDNVCEACGWMAACLAMLSFGSFAAPIKSQIVVSLNVDPLVFQTYKTAMCFVTCWIVLLLGHPFSFSPWGIVSGLFWVPGGVGTIFAVKTAGMAVGVGVASSVIVLVSFTWGIFVFQENVRSRLGACFAVAMMIFGIIGMSNYSAPDYSLVDNTLSNMLQNEQQSIETSFHENSPQRGEENQAQSIAYDEMNEAVDNSLMEESVQGDRSSQLSSYLCYGVSMRSLGICAAIFNGLWGGSIMVPMHWSR
jgi:hypothetical protein